MNRCLGCMESFDQGLQVCPYCGYVVGSPVVIPTHMAPGMMLHNRYIIGKVLGSGGFGVTYIGWDNLLEQKVAIKEYLPGDFSSRVPGQSRVTIFEGDRSEQFRDGMLKFVEEARHLALFKSDDGIVQIFDSFEENDTAYIIMEYLDGETLASYLKRNDTIPAEDAVAMLMPVLESLGTLHEEGLLHRDIAPDNIFLTRDGKVKLIDFGASRYATTSHSRSLTVIIKQGYSPEEQYRSRDDHGPHTDVYAVAATLYKMITGKTPPDAMERRANYEGKNKDILVEPRKLNKDVPKNIENAVLNAMNVRIEDRTPDTRTFIEELTSEEPVKRIYGKIKKIDLYHWPMWIKVGLASILAFSIGLAVLIFTGVIDFNLFSDEIVVAEDVRIVPDVEGMSSKEALELIASHQLLASTDGNIESEYLQAGQIVLQTPTGGSYMHINGTVLLSISSGSSVQGAVNGIATVPFVIWDMREDAVAKLQTAGLGYPIIEEVNDENVTAGQVISQSIEAGEEVKEGTVITLVVSLGAASFEMPDVQGMDATKAEQTLLNRGLVVHMEYEKNDEVPEDKVIRQGTPAGTEVKRGDEITLVVSSGKSTVEVADVVGENRQDAVAALEAQGFKVVVYENFDTNVAKDCVISQTPAAGSSQLPGTTITLYVSKGKQLVEVFLDGNGGSVTPNTLTVSHTGKYEGLPTPSRSGYSFLGWFTQAAGGSRVTADTIVTSSGAHTLYAQWGTQVYNVRFDPAGGSISTGALTVSYGNAYGSLPVPSRAGHHFVGWFTSPTGGSQVTSDMKVAITGDQMLYARWTAKQFTITFNGNGGSVSTGNKTVTYGAAYGILPTPTKTGTTFTGWYTAASGGTQVTEATVVNIDGNQTLYARWSTNAYVVSFNANGGAVSGGNKTVGYGAAYGTLPTPTRDYHNFDGWYTEASGGSKVTAETIFSVAGNQTLYAHWVQKPVSGWVLESQLPSGAEVTNQKWTYTETITTESTATSMAGYTQTGSRWVQTGTGSVNYASIPGGFDTGHSLYSKLNHSAYSAYENATTKRTVSNSWAGYVYWHWMYDTNKSNGTSGRAIFNKYGKGPVSGFVYKYFGAFTSTKAYTDGGTGYCENLGIRNYIVNDRTSWADCQGNLRWFRFDYYTSTYTDYQKYFTYQKTENKESATAVSSSGTITNVQKWVQYREK